MVPPAGGHRPTPRSGAEEFGQRIATIAATEEAEHQSLHDPFDRSVALVLSLVREEEFNPWSDLSAFLNVFAKRVKDGENLTFLRVDD